MNDKVKKLIETIGALSEIWTIVYRSFLAQDMDTDTALTHTQAFMSVLTELFMATGETESKEK